MRLVARGPAVFVRHSDSADRPMWPGAAVGRHDSGHFHPLPTRSPHRARPVSLVPGHTWARLGPSPARSREGCSLVPPLWVLSREPGQIQSRAAHRLSQRPVRRTVAGTLGHQPGAPGTSSASSRSKAYLQDDSETVPLPRSKMTRKPVPSRDGRATHESCDDEKEAR